MNVGLMTYHSVPNYGAALQAYALYRAIEQLGHEVSIIDHSNSNLDEYYSSHSFKTPMDLFYYFRKRKKAKLIEGFIDSELGSRRLKANDPSLEAAVCGSDQIWSIQSAQGFDSAYFLSSVKPGIRKLSYAPSANETATFKPHAESIKQLLTEFTAVSVRDTHTYELVKNECGIESLKVLDPTLLVDFSSVSQAPQLDQDYLLVYLNGDVTPDKIQFIQSVAEQKGLKIVSIDGFPRKLAKRYMALSPNQWVGLFEKAAHVITNTFHGTIFSIKYRKPLSVLVSPHKASKVLDLLATFSIKQVEDLSKFHNGEVDYDVVYERLEAEKQSSFKFLRGALEG